MTNTTIKEPTSNIPNSFWIAIGLNMVWINLSEVFRYFAFVMPMMRDAFPMLPSVAPMNIPVFLIWGIWDTILVVSVCAIAWLSLTKFGTTMLMVLLTATGIWASIFVILWLGLFNMNLASPSIVLVALPLAWLEMFVAVIIVRWAMMRE
ncbi:MAG: hypothetical protein AAGF25_04770 [Pseudomonadota bacterium]